MAALSLSLSITHIRASFVFAAIWEPRFCFKPFGAFFSQILRFVDVCCRFRSRYAECEPSGGCNRSILFLILYHGAYLGERMSGSL